MHRFLYIYLLSVFVPLFRSLSFQYVGAFTVRCFLHSRLLYYSCSRGTCLGIQIYFSSPRSASFSFSSFVLFPFCSLSLSLFLFFSALGPSWDLWDRRLRHWQESVSSPYDDGTRSRTAACSGRAGCTRRSPRRCWKQRHWGRGIRSGRPSTIAYRNVNRNCRAAVEIDTARLAGDKAAVARSIWY